MTNNQCSLLIDFAGVTLVRGDNVISRNLTLQIARGEHVAILGPNGSGKSTTIKLLLGLSSPPVDRRWFSGKMPRTSPRTSALDICRKSPIFTSS